jgi:hypothetical protein
VDAGVAGIALLSCLGWFGGCGGDEDVGKAGSPGVDGGAHPDGGTGAEVGSDAALDGTLPDGNAPDAGIPAVPVTIENGRLLLEGKPSFLYGGELHYFRVRDKGHDAQKTLAMWQDSVAKLKNARMNLVTTYFPWDYHAPQDGSWDFSGSRDADAFLKVVCDAGLKVVAKPGPLITGEWPRGFGSFGAVPEWWKQAHPEALALKANGEPFDFNSLPGGTPNYQPSYLHPDFLSYVEGWYDTIVPVLRKYIDSRCVVGVQIDNETNLYWAERFGVVDYNPVALDHYRQFLASRYAKIASLNAAYGTTYGSFDDVEAPTSLPSSTKDNVAARDWYDAGQAIVLAYLQRLRDMIAVRGIVEPDVLMMTNDAPFTLVGTVASTPRYVLMHDPRVKNQIGLAGLDTYSKFMPDIPGTTGPLSNFPFQPDYYTKLFDSYGALYTGDDASRYVFGAELQGGFYQLPLGLSSHISPESTGQLIAKTVGHGLKGGSFYIIRGGLNMDDSEYDFQAAIGIDGTLRPRYEVFRRWGEFLAHWGEALMDTEDVEDSIAIVQDLSYAVPQAGTNDDHQMLYAHEYAGLFGWLMNAGFNPAVLDAKLAPDLSRYEQVYFILPKMADPATAQMLVDYHEQGGTLIQLLDPGSTDLAGAPNASVDALASLFPVSYQGKWDWPGLPQAIHYGDVNSTLPSYDGTMRTYWYQTYWEPLPGVDAQALVAERLPVINTDGKPVALQIDGAGATRVLVGGHVGSGFSGDIYYDMSASELEGKRELARYLAGLAGVTPILSVDGYQQLAWARKSRKADGPLFLFVENDGAAGTVSIRLHDGDALGLVPARLYEITNGLDDKSLGARSGSELTSTALQVDLPKHGVTVLVIEAAP